MMKTSSPFFFYLLKLPFDVRGLMGPESDGGWSKATNGGLREIAAIYRSSKRRVSKREQTTAATDLE